MNEDKFNMELRKFLKKLGITSQREIENAVRSALEQGRISGGETLPVSARVSIPELGLETEVTGEIALE